MKSGLVFTQASKYLRSSRPDGSHRHRRRALEKYDVIFDRENQKTNKTNVEKVKQMGNVK